MKKERIMETGDILDEMRLMVEGAIVLFEDDALPLTRLARDSNEFAAGSALNMIGTALYNLRTFIREMQEMRFQRPVSDEQA